MAIYNVNVTSPDGVTSTVRVDATSRGAALSQARNLRPGSRVGSAVQVTPTRAEAEAGRISQAQKRSIRNDVAKIQSQKNRIDNIIEGDETPAQEAIKSATESALVQEKMRRARLILGEGREAEAERFRLLGEAKQAEVTAAAAAYRRELERTDPDLLEEIDAESNRVFQGTTPNASWADVSSRVAAQVNTQGADVEAIRRAAEQQKNNAIAAVATEEEIDEYKYGEEVKGFVPSVDPGLVPPTVTPEQQATQPPAFQNFAIDEGTDVGFGAGTGVVPGAQPIPRRLPTMPRRLPSIDEGTDVGFGAGLGSIPGATPMPRPVAPGPRVVRDASTLPRLGTVPTTTDQFAGLAEQELPFAAPRTTTPQVRVDELVPAQEGQMTAAQQAGMIQPEVAGTFDAQVATGAIPGVDVTEAGAPSIAYAGAPAPSVVNVQTGIDPGLTGQAPNALGPGAAFGGTPAPATGTEVVPAAPGSFGEFVAGPEAAGIPTPGMSAAPTLQQPIQFGGLTDQDLEGISSRAAVNRAVQNLYGQQPTAVGPISDFLRRQSFSLVPAQQLGTLAQIATGQLSPQARATSFSDYLRNLEGRGGAATGFGEALQNLQTLRGLDPTSLSPSAAGAQYIFSPGTDEETGQALQFLGAAQRGRYSPFVSSIFRPGSQDEIFADYVVEADRRAREGQAARNFLDFAAGRFGL